MEMVGGGAACLCIINNRVWWYKGSLHPANSSSSACLRANYIQGSIFSSLQSFFREQGRDWTKLTRDLIIECICAEPGLNSSGGGGSLNRYYRLVIKGEEEGEVKVREEFRFCLAGVYRALSDTVPSAVHSYAPVKKRGRNCARPGIQPAPMKRVRILAEFLRFVCVGFR